MTATGTLQPVITSPVGAQVSGIVWKLHADFNSPVKAGDLLVELDPASFENAVALATSALAQSEANLTSAQATALGARSARDRTANLERAALASDADVDATQAIFAQTAGLARSSVALIAQAQAHAFARTMHWPFVLTPFWIVVAFGISMAIGVIFGFYPARKAARMNPIDALRFE